jgi:hypothetical protein
MILPSRGLQSPQGWLELYQHERGQRPSLSANELRRFAQERLTRLLEYSPLVDV